jgi:hypothetical protein
MKENEETGKKKEKLKLNYNWVPDISDSGRYGIRTLCIPYFVK